MEANRKKRRYITGFDGIRSLAVVAVILYHLVPYDIQGGYLGVPIFFVLSGYLITDILNAEIRKSGKVNVWNFYKKRMKRLYPALVAMVIGTSAYITLFQRDMLQNIRQTIIANLVYVYNWVQVRQGQSYFDRFGPQAPFTHLWSLSIEGQFYLFWPLILTVLWVLLRKKQPVFDVIFIVAFISALMMALLYRQGQDPSRIYFGTDTRMFAILLGAALSILWPSGSLKSNLNKKGRWFLDMIGTLSLALIILMFFNMPGESELTYRGGMFFFTVIATLFVATVAHPGADMNSVMSNPLFTWLGKRSYGIYLYQFPVMIFYEARVTNIADHPWIHSLIEITIIILISHISYVYLELPLQHFDYSQTKRVVTEFLKRNSRYGWQRLWVFAGLILGVLALAGAVTEPSASTNKNSQQLKQVIEKNQRTVARGNSLEQKKDVTSKKVAKSAASQSTSSSQAQSSSSENTNAKPYDLSEIQKQQAQKLSITAVGDSVMADGSAKLQEIFPQMYIDAQVGRQARDAIAVLQSLAQKGRLANVVLISLGTNGPFSDDELSQIMSAVGNRQVFWINTHVPTRRWQNQVNDSLKTAATKYHNLKVIDWYGYSNNHSDWFYEDNVHPNEYGLNYYSSYIAKEILEHS
ncbi:acyltransferase family protein [Liquorilactobacillus oeni]|uniref:Acyltransferase n=1 Tax=Liquorilactobacillus oeni DSM 19972 TaxID=1423777 RepID=A0A0R1MA06_9LACO|nr:acyltransferase family protein [Liquorilactobacillus oeni]KRL04729.1 acyltransferase [Liquorilactobacillus oeni DSM 19972]